MVISWLVLKLGVVRFATSFLVVLLANVLNRVLIVDLTVPAALVTFSFAFQHVMTPVGLVTGYFSDNYAVRGRRRAPYIWGGMLLSVAVMPFFPNWALDLGAQPHSRLLLYQGVLLFSLFGIGTTVSATAINALLVDRVPERDRGGALTMVWILTLLGFIVGSALAGVLFPAFDPDKIQPALCGGHPGGGGGHPLGGLGHRTAQRGRGRPGASPDGPVAHLEIFGQQPAGPDLFCLSGDHHLFPGHSDLPPDRVRRGSVGPAGGRKPAGSGFTPPTASWWAWWGCISWSPPGRTGGTKWFWWSSLVVGAAAFGLLSLTSFKPDPTWGIYALCLLGLARGFYNVGLSHLTMSMAHPTFSGVFMGLWNLASGLALAAGEMTGGFLKDRLVYLSGSEAGAYGWVFLLEGVGLLACLLFLVPLSLEKYRPQLAVLVADKPVKPY